MFIKTSKTLYYMKIMVCKISPWGQPISGSKAVIMKINLALIGQAVLEEEMFEIVDDDEDDDDPDHDGRRSMCIL